MAPTFQEYIVNIAKLTTRRQSQLLEAWLTVKDTSETRTTLLTADISQAPSLRASRRVLYIPSSPIPSDNEDY